MRLPRMTPGGKWITWRKLTCHGREHAGSTNTRLEQYSNSQCWRCEAELLATELLGRLNMEMMAWMQPHCEAGVPAQYPPFVVVLFLVAAAAGRLTWVWGDGLGSCDSHVLTFWRLAGSCGGSFYTCPEQASMCSPPLTPTTVRLHTTQHGKVRRNWGRGFFFGPHAISHMSVGDCSPVLTAWPPMKVTVTSYFLKPHHILSPHYSIAPVPLLVSRTHFLLLYHLPSALPALIIVRWNTFTSWHLCSRSIKWVSWTEQRTHHVRNASTVNKLRSSIPPALPSRSPQPGGSTILPYEHIHKSVALLYSPTHICSRTCHVSSTCTHLYTHVQVSTTVLDIWSICMANELAFSLHGSCLISWLVHWTLRSAYALITEGGWTQCTNPYECTFDLQIRCAVWLHKIMITLFLQTYCLKNKDFNELFQWPCYISYSV